MRTPAVAAASGNQAHLRRLAINGQPLQQKLQIGAVDDPLEHEADQVAATVMRMPAGQLRRKCATCAAEEEMVRTKRAGGGDIAGEEAPAIVAEALSHPGKPLDAPTRAFMEPRFGADLGQVRIQDDGLAGRATLAVGAKAFAVGNQLAFAPGEYRPHTEEGRRLLAHELAHSQQQAGPAAPLRRTSYSDCTQPQLDNLVKPAVTMALADLNVVIPALAARPLAAETEAALFLAFRGDDPATADKVKDSLQTIKSGLENQEITCTQPNSLGAVGKTLTPEAMQCVRDRLGYTNAAFNVHICMNSWPGASDVLRAMVLIHEGAHAFKHMVGDNGYFTYGTCGQSAATAGLSTADRLRNPDSFSCFVQYMRHDTGLVGKAASYKGTSLGLTQTPAGPVNLAGDDPKVPLFAVSGVPANSGFKFKWSVLDGAGRAYAMQSDRGDPNSFGDALNVYIGAATRTTLRQLHGTTGKVVCQVQVPGVGSRTIEQPVTFAGL